MRVSVTTLGCKSNQYDSAAIEDALREASLEVVPFPGPADAFVINTCTVTSSTDRQSRQLIRRVRSLNPAAVVLVTGCYAQVSPNEVSSIEGVDYVIGNPDKGRVVEYLLKGRAGTAQSSVGAYTEGTPFSLRARSSSWRTRANLKIQEGCNRRCSYCIIPMARGLSKSLPIANVEKEIDSLAEAGYKEIILTGIHLGAYGRDLGSISLTDVLRLIERKDYPCRFRISSIDPDEVTEEIIEILSDAKRVCNHLHLPLQSGNDRIIRRMKRPYTARAFSELVEALVERVPGISIGVDVIAGFPGEGEKEFGSTLSLLRDLPVSYLHVFPYSRRKGTPAASFGDQVPGDVIKERCAMLSELDRVKRKAFYERFVGKTASVLVEGARDRGTGLPKGRARNYIPVLMEGGVEPGSGNTFVDALLTGYSGSAMTGIVEGASK